MQSSHLQTNITWWCVPCFFQLFSIAVMSRHRYSLGPPAFDSAKHCWCYNWKEKVVHQQNSQRSFSVEWAGATWKDTIAPPALLLWHKRILVIIYNKSKTNLLASNTGYVIHYFNRIIADASKKCSQKATNNTLLIQSATY